MPQPSLSLQYSPGGTYGTAFFHIFPYLEEDNRYNAHKTTTSTVYGPSTTSTTTYTGGTPGGSYYYSEVFTTSSAQSIQLASPVTIYAGYTVYTYSYGSYSYSYTEPAYDGPKWLVADSDPSQYSYGGQVSYTSYLLNDEVFSKSYNVGNIPDGTSQTIFMAEGWANCYGYSYTNNNYNDSGRYNYYGYYDYSYSLNYTYQSGSYNFSEVVAFSYDPKFNLIAGKSFQANAVVGNCDGSMPNAFNSGIIQVLMGDGSVRTVSSGVLATTWAAAVTPAGNDVLGSDW